LNRPRFVATLDRRCALSAGSASAASVPAPQAPAAGPTRTGSAPAAGPTRTGSAPAAAPARTGSAGASAAPAPKPAAPKAAAPPLPADLEEKLNVLRLKGNDLYKAGDYDQARGKCVATKEPAVRRVKLMSAQRALSLCHIGHRSPLHGRHCAGAGRPPGGAAAAGQSRCVQLGRQHVQAVPGGLQRHPQHRSRRREGAAAAGTQRATSHEAARRAIVQSAHGLRPSTRLPTSNRPRRTRPWKSWTRRWRTIAKCSSWTPASWQQRRASRGSKPVRAAVKAICPTSLATDWCSDAHLPLIPRRQAPAGEALAGGIVAVGLAVARRRGDAGRAATFTVRAVRRNLPGERSGCSRGSLSALCGCVGLLLQPGCGAAQRWVEHQGRLGQPIRPDLPIDQPQRQRGPVGRGIGSGKYARWDEWVREETYCSLHRPLHALPDGTISCATCAGTRSR